MTDRRSARRPRRNNRASQATARIADNPRARRWRQLRNPFTPQRVFSDDRIEHLHRTALRVLAELGMRVLLPEARKLFAAAGAEVDEQTEMVRIDPHLSESLLATAPSEFAMLAGDPSRDLRLGGDSVAFVPVGGPPHVSDLDRGKRPGTLADFEDLVRLAQAFDVIHLAGPSVEPQDVPVQVRHLRMMLGALTLCDKPFFVYSRGSVQVADSLQMLRIARGLDETQLGEGVYAYTVINTNSPRQLDIPMCQGLIDFARAGQMSIVTPFTLAGAMAPVTIAGALVQAHAEAIAGIALAQIARPAAPVVYGSFTSNVDMRSGAPAFGTPEYVQAAIGAGQLARRLGLPWRSSAATAANAPDAQAVYETQMSAWGALLGGANVILHAAGWLEGGLTASLEKFILDIECLQILAEAMQPVAADDDAIAFEAMAEVQPGGHYFGAAHTMTRYDTAFYTPLVSDWSNFGQWTETGSLTATQRANRVWKQVLAEFEPPPMDPGRREALDDFVDRRSAEGGAPPVG